METRPEIFHGWSRRLVLENVEPEISRIVLPATSTQGRVFSAHRPRTNVQRMYPSIEVSGDDAMQDLPLAVTFLPNVEITPLVQEIGKSFVVRHPVHDMPL